MSKLFVYGSLKRNKSAHRLLQDHHAIFLKEAVTAPQYHIYQISWFPGMVEDDVSEGGVHGEVYEVTQECFRQLDVYEGVPHLFRQKLITLSDGDQVFAYIYARPFSGKQRIESGVWDE